MPCPPSIRYSWCFGSEQDCAHSAQPRQPYRPVQDIGKVEKPQRAKKRRPEPQDAFSFRQSQNQILKLQSRCREKIPYSSFFTATFTFTITSRCSFTGTS